MRTAATLVLLRDTGDTPEVLLVRRSSRSRNFASSWVFPGGAVDDADATPSDSGEIDVARRAAVREAREECGLDVPVAALVPLSCWVPPAEAPVQLRTYHFVARAPDQPARPDGTEIVDAVWIRPHEALAQHAEGRITFMPPTWMTLHNLMALPDVASALVPPEPGPPTYATVVRKSDGGTTLAWPGADDLALDITALPWRLTAPGLARDDERRTR